MSIDGSGIEHTTCCADFLAGTQSLGSAESDVAVETSTAMDEEESEEVDPITITLIPNSPNIM